MIARVWTAQTTSGQLPPYLEHLRGRVVPDLQALQGYRGMTILDRPLTDGIEVVVITYWLSMDAVRGFAGADVERAIITREAAALLVRFDERVRHYVVAFADGAASAEVT